MTMKAAVNALTLALATEYQFLDIVTAKEFAVRFFEDNADMFSAPAYREATPAEVKRVLSSSDARAVVGASDPERAPVFTQPVIGPDGLTDKQRAALGTVGLCPNCQQPKDDHLPGCARASGEDPKARTKDRLSPAV